MQWGDSLNLGLGLLAIVAPYLWPSMPKSFSYPAAGFGFLLLGYSGIAALQDWTHMKLAQGPLLTIISGLIVVALGVGWHIYLSKTTALAGETAPTAAMPDDNGKNNVTISGSNNQVTIGHIGDVINQAPAPELTLGSVTRKETSNGYETVIDAEVLSPYPVGTLNLEAWAPGITRFEAQMQRSGTQMTGHSGVRPDYAFTSVQNAFGKYKLYIQTPHAENIEIKYGFNQ